MNSHRPSASLVLFVLCIWLPGCKSSSNPISSSSKALSIRVSLRSYDEFWRQIPVTGPIDITVTGSDETIHSALPDGWSSLLFTNLGNQKYTVTAQKQGCYPCTATPSGPGDTLYVNFNLYAFPSALVRIDSIECIINSVVPQLVFRLSTAQVLPAGGTRSAVLFAGTGPDVNPRFGEYFFVAGTNAQSVGTSEIYSNDVYRQLHHAGFASGTRVFVTARLTSGATSYYQDAGTGLLVFSNLEENSRVVTSFIMP